MVDKPVAHREDGSPVFDNTPTVVIVLVPLENSRRLLAVLRGNNPGRGLVGLPGGYQMRGESWQEAGAREVFEETGYRIYPGSLKQIGPVVTDEYGNNLIIAQHSSPPASYEPKTLPDPETIMVLGLTEVGPESHWAFPRHYDAAVRFFI
ncbi:NUDIX domain-containing protein [Aminobacter anthyllidis]|uniref:NUDIX domain-containing protein n=1 Tax=Aminobacter anthyllidis TaxID=1035067 RepID=A0A9X1D215_9HYPH|nr:NUDIX domain-containing protein [Aminobacter anthyllidis]MBT1154442.1 NUDIX domain-containing protein [Aminobacter anthyllidis]